MTEYERSILCNNAINITNRKDFKKDPYIFDDLEPGDAFIFLADKSQTPYLKISHVDDNPNDIINLLNGEWNTIYNKYIVTYKLPKLRNLIIPECYLNDEIKTSDNHGLPYRYNTNTFDLSIITRDDLVNKKIKLRKYLSEKDYLSLLEEFNRILSSEERSDKFIIDYETFVSPFICNMYNIANITVEPTPFNVVTGSYVLTQVLNGGIPVY